MQISVIALSKPTINRIMINKPLKKKAFKVEESLYQKMKWILQWSNPQPLVVVCWVIIIIIITFVRFYLSMYFNMVIVVFVDVMLCFWK